MSPRRAVRRLAIGVLLLTAPAGTARADGGAKPGSVEKITLQYRVARDAYAPSRFVAVIDGGLSTPLEIQWDIPESKQRAKARLEELLRDLEAGEINGVEFECRGRWSLFRTSLTLTTVPELTTAGRKRIQEHKTSR